MFDTVDKITAQFTKVIDKLEKRLEVIVKEKTQNTSKIMQIENQNNNLREEEIKGQRIVQKLRELVA